MPQGRSLHIALNRVDPAAYGGWSGDLMACEADAADMRAICRANHSGKADAFARLFLVPGMNHCSGGPATDQFDMLAPLVAWVEQGKAPDSVTAKARGAGANVVNTELFY